MADDKYIGIRFPFEEDLKGKFFALTKTSMEAVKSNLLLLLTTPIGSRLYKPEFGTNFLRYIYSPMDNQTYSAIRNEIESAVSKNFQNISIEKVQIDVDEQDYAVGFKIEFLYNDGVFRQIEIVNVSLI